MSAAITISKKAARRTGESRDSHQNEVEVEIDVVGLQQPIQFAYRVSEYQRLIDLFVSDSTSITCACISFRSSPADFEHTFATYESLPADIFLGAHGAYFDMLNKLERGARTNPALWIDRDGYKAAIAKAHTNFEAELVKQKAAR